MATKKKATGTQNRSSAKHKVITGEVPVGEVSLSAEDREYLEGSLNSARSRMGENARTDESGMFEMLEKFGLGSARVERLRKALGRLSPADAVEKAGDYLAEQIESAKDYSRENPGKVIGGAAGVLVGASLLAMALNRAAGEESSSRRSSSASSSRGGSKGSRRGGSRKSTAATAASSGTAAASTSSKRGGAKKSSARKSASKKSAGSTKRSSGTSSRKSSGGSTGSTSRKTSSRRSAGTAARKSSAKRSTGAKRSSSR